MGFIYIVLWHLLNLIRYNGFGGKVEPGETPLEAAVRELKVRSAEWLISPYPYNSTGRVWIGLRT